MPRTKRLHALKRPVCLLIIMATLPAKADEIVETPPGLVEMEPVQPLARDHASGRQQDLFPAEMGSQKYAAFIP